MVAHCDFFKLQPLFYLFNGGCCLNPLVSSSSSSNTTGNTSPSSITNLNGSPLSNRSTQTPSSPFKLHSVVSNIPLGVLRLLANLIVAVPLVPLTLNQTSILPCIWFIVP